MDNTEKDHDHRIQRWFRFVRSRMARPSPWGCYERNDLLVIVPVHHVLSPPEKYRHQEAMDIMRMPISKDLDRCRTSTRHMNCLPVCSSSDLSTTSIIEYLEQQERVKLVSRRLTPTDRHREIHRFDRNTYDWAIPWLELGDEWASSPSIPQNDPGYSVVHYTPHYLYAPSVPFDVKKLYPHSDDASQMKFIVVLRDPVARALSSYWFSQSHLFEDRRKKGEKKGNIGSIGEFQTLATQEMESRVNMTPACGEHYWGLASKVEHCWRKVPFSQSWRQTCRQGSVLRPTSALVQYSSLPPSLSRPSVDQSGPRQGNEEVLHFIGADKDKDGNEVNSGIWR